MRAWIWGLPRQANFIVWGGIAGGIFFNEFATLHHHPDVGAAAWAFYFFGLTLILVGLYLVRPDPEEKGPKEKGNPPSIEIPM